LRYFENVESILIEIGKSGIVTALAGTFRVKAKIVTHLHVVFIRFLPTLKYMTFNDHFTLNAGFDPVFMTALFC